MGNFENIHELADQRGLFFPSAEIHSPPSGFWDFGHLGTILRRKITDLWRKEIVRKTDSLEIEGCLILPKQNFEASGHLKGFVDPLIQCKKCHKIFRADKLIEKKSKKEIPEALGTKEFDGLIKKHKITCPECKGQLAKTKKFNMMIGTSIGPLSKEINAYLRPETCQNIFTAFQKIYKTSRVSLPLAISQVGRAFRNEISPRQGLVRTREFSQFETEVFFNPKKINNFPEFEKYKNKRLRLKLLGKDKVESVKLGEAVKKKIVSGKLIAYYLAITQEFFEKAGLDPKNIRFRELEDRAKAFYSEETWDFEVNTSVGWLELVACNYRTDFDLSSHSKVSKTDLTVVEDEEKFVPHVFELSMGLDRIFYAILENSLSERSGKPVLKFPRELTPLDIVILPLVRKDGIDKKAKEIHDLLKTNFETKYDEKQSIGKRYVIYDQLGVPLAITVDYDSLKKKDVTLRDRDSMKQIRVKINDLPSKINDFFAGRKIF
ncbi:MAG: glycine--tRNA ligase [Candidatus Aenigmarchaeota archaeon]|nr:glycine--tRNA ligase [Candidatus Aenigmarchaeota archaeon]